MIRAHIEIEDAYVQMMDRFGDRTRAVELALRYVAGQPLAREWHLQ
jgi:hypothetical protein